MNYTNISDFGPNTYSPVNDPWSYCLNDNMDQRFLHGGHADTLGQHSKNCQLFTAEYCAKKWDGLCEVASKNTNSIYPNNAEGCTNAGDIGCRGMTAGDALIHNTAAEKYLIKMHNATKKYEPFDPTVANSPMISYWVNEYCSYANSRVPEYAVDPAKIDDDIVMNKILRNPIIAMDILINIYNTMKRKGTLSQLSGTKLGNLYNNHPYFKNKGGVSK